VEPTQEQAEGLIALSHEQGFTFRWAQGVTLLGWALVKQERKEEGIAQIRQGLAATRASGAELWPPHFFALLAEACGEAGQADEGLTAITEALDLTSSTGHAFYETELFRLKGELLLMQSDSHAAQAESCFQSAIEVALRQCAKSWELRATVSLARLLRDTDRRDEARAMLAEIYNWFTEGFDTADLKEAKALLEELATE
jgi:predicted ATPase